MIYLTLIISIFTTIYCGVIGIVIYGFIRQKKLPKNTQNKSHTNKISVIIPVRNETENIINCLQSLENQQFDKLNFEIIVINDHSTDNTVKLIDDYKKRTKLKLQLLALTNTFSKKEALKYGVKIAKHPIIATTDADCILPNKWLANIALNFNESTEMLIGPVMFAEKKSFLCYFQILDMLAIQGIEFACFYYKQPILNNAANLAYTKKMYTQLAGYDNHKTPSGDDIFLLEKFKTQNKNNIRALLNVDFIVKTNFQHTFKAFWHQRLRWASKTKYYKDKLLIFISLIMLIQNFFQLFIYFELLFVEKFRLISLFLVFCKWLFDFILLFLTSSFFNKRKSLVYFVPVQIIYPFYITCVGIVSNWAKFEWKGRNFNG